MKDAFEIPDQEVFASIGTLTLSDVLSRCEQEQTGPGLRDMRSAFRFLSEILEINLDSVLARPQDVRVLFALVTAARAGVSPKRLANVKSLIVRAVREHGMRRTWVTREIPLAPAWSALLGRIEEDMQRWGLSRFSAYCTVNCIDHEEVTSETLIGFEVALDREEISKDPRNIRKHTIALWNMCLKRVPD